MSENLQTNIYRILENGQQSISGITRQLKEEGFDTHRLILTGYLRALRDLDKLDEVDIPPSKVYMLVKAIEYPQEDIYSIIGNHLISLDYDARFPVAVYIVSELFERPVFREEFKLMGINPTHIKHCLDLPACVVGESSDKGLKQLRNLITRIAIPSSDPAYRIVKENDEIVQVATHVLVEIVKDVVSISGLVPKTKQTKLV
ncbi:MAG: hypothetical protein ACXQTE_04955 [Methanosarcinaceae archaeon]